MKTRMFRFVFALMLVFSVLGFFPATVLADQPVITKDITLTLTSLTNDICPFTIQVDASFVYTDMLYFDKSGALVRGYDHVIETDVFSANGKTLTSLPYTYNIEYIFDNSGNLIHAYGSGESLKVILPDGSLFNSAGRLDVVTHPGQTFYFPDKGHIGNLAAFCAALAP